MFSQSSSPPVLKIYNAFPTRFDNGLAGLIAYIPTIQDLGFNCIWLNPIFYAGPSWVQKYDAYLFSSCYAMSSMTLLDPRVLPDTEVFVKYKKEIKAIEDELKVKWAQHNYQRGNLQLVEVKEFLAKLSDIERRYSEIFKPLLAQLVQAAHAHHLTIIGDLVMNHVSSLQIAFTGGDIQKYLTADRSFPDVFKINYADLMRMDKGLYERVISQWKEFISNQFLELGFDGFRVDAARLLPNVVLDQIYGFIRKSRQNAIIFEEVLFSDKSQETQAVAFGTRKVLPSAVTGSVYYYYFEKSGGRISSFGQVESGSFQNKYGSIDDEAYWKSQYTQLGTVNFVGNHDHTSFMGKLVKSNFASADKKQEMWLATYAAIALSGAGGSYLLAGDEWGFESTPRPFVAENGLPVFTKDIDRETKLVEAELIRHEMPLSKAQQFYQNHIRLVHAIMDKMYSPYANDKKDGNDLNWVRPVYVPKFNLLIMTRRYGQETKGKTDIVVIDLLPAGRRELKWEQIASSFEMNPLSEIKLNKLEDVTLHLYGVAPPKKENYAVIEYGISENGKVNVVDHQADVSLESGAKTPAAAAAVSSTPVSDIRVIRDAAMLHGIFTRSEEAQQRGNVTTTQVKDDSSDKKLK